jgi:putative SOS response-associated peptidase YedK
MCSRFVLTSDLSTIEEAFDVEDEAGIIRQSDKIVPGQNIAVVINDGINRLVLFYWGLIPSSARDRSISRGFFNARSETVAIKPSFRNAFKNRRCLIIADGFYEWQKLGNVRKPFYFYLKSRQPFGFAGLYESWVSPEKRTIDTCTIITTEPNDLVKPIHERMPVIVPKDKEHIWLDTALQDLAVLHSIMTPYPSDEMEKMDLSGFK